MDINTCFETTKDYQMIAIYSHLIPMLITLTVSGFVLLKSNFSRLCQDFFLFSTSFCAWLLGDVILWVSSDYNLVSFFWAPLDYINIIFFILGAYFFVNFVGGTGLNLRKKIIGLVLCFPAWWITITNHSIIQFNQPVCEASNNYFLTNYKFFIEIIIIGFILFYAFLNARKVEKRKKIQITVVSLALLLFFATFSVTEYISSQTGVYEINLYSLFVLPIFLLI